MINASLYGIIKEAAAHCDKAGHVYGMINGIEGFLKGTILDFEEALPGEKLKYLTYTPGAYLAPAAISFRRSMKTRLFMRRFLKS